MQFLRNRKIRPEVDQEMSGGHERCKPSIPVTHRTSMMCSGISGKLQSCFFHLPFSELFDSSVFRQAEITFIHSIKMG